MSRRLRFGCRPLSCDPHQAKSQRDSGPLPQDCGARANLGYRPQIISNRNAVAVIPARPSCATFATTALRLMNLLDDDPRLALAANLGLAADAPLGHSVGIPRESFVRRNSFGLGKRRRDSSYFPHADVEWQGGYADFSVSQSSLEHYCRSARVRLRELFVGESVPAGTVRQK